MRRIRMVQMYQDNISDKASRPMEIETRIEVDDLRLR